MKAKKKDDADGADDEEAKGEKKVFSNQRLLTPKMKKLMQNKDAREVLQEEIEESSLRLKQAKFGHKLVDIVPNHENSFYLPDKGKYLPPEKKENSNNQ